MTRYNVRPMAELAHGDLRVSRLHKGLQPEHKDLFPNWSPDFLADRRQTVTYRFGPSITEPGIADRCARDEISYRAAPRLSRFALAEIHNAIVEPTHMIVCADGSVVRETVRPNKTLEMAFPDASRSDIEAAMQDPAASFDTARLDGPLRTVGTGFLLGYGVHLNYFNWTIRYAAGAAFAVRFGGDATILVPGGGKPFVASTLDFFGVDRAKVVYVEHPVRVEKLWLGSQMATNRYGLSPAMVMNLQAHPKVVGAPDTGQRKLYIPRTGVKFRFVENEADVIKRLADRGFSILDSAKHSLADQVAAFRSADVVVCAHGAGLANIVYCRPGTTIVELIPERYDQGVTSYRSLADMFDLTYVPLFSRWAAPGRAGRPETDDTAVDIEELVEVLDELPRS